jgi:hypothetical protein
VGTVDLTLRGDPRSRTCVADIAGGICGRRADKAFLDVELDLKAGTGQIVVALFCDVHAAQGERRPDILRDDGTLHAGQIVEIATASTPDLLN